MKKSKYLLSFLVLVLLCFCLLLLDKYAVNKQAPPVLKTTSSSVGPLDTKQTSEFIRAKMKVCYDSGGPNACYKEAAQAFMENFGLAETLADFAADEQQPEIFSRCHEVTHYLGRSAYEQSKSVPDIYAQCTYVCHGGCYHGVIEQYFKDNNTVMAELSDEVLQPQIQSICGRQQDYSVPRTYSECVHGIGHAMMYITDQELPHSLKLCDFLQTLSDRETCYGGVFMENSSSSTNLDHPTEYLKPSDPMYPCDILDKQFLKVCYQYQSSYFAELSKWDWQKTAQLCQKVPQEFADGCATILGSNLVGYTEDMEVIKNVCNQMPTKNFRRDCVAGVISSLGGRFIGDMAKMENFCNSINVQEQEICYNAVGNSVSSWSAEQSQVEEKCSSLKTPQYIAWCRDHKPTELLINQ